MRRRIGGSVAGPDESARRGNSLVSMRFRVWECASSMMMLCPSVILASLMIGKRFVDQAEQEPHHAWASLWWACSCRWSCWAAMWSGAPPIMDIMARPPVRKKRQISKAASDRKMMFSQVV
jgi:hypothetical protein